MKRNGNAVWNGTGKEGSGHLSTQSGVLNKANYSWSSRFENAIGTNPEELIAAAHAGCFSMKLSFVLGTKGLTADEIATTCTITLEDGTIKESHLEVKGKVPGATTEVFNEAVTDAAANCPVSKLLIPGTNVTHSAELV